MRTAMTALALALLCSGAAADEQPMTAPQTAAQTAQMERVLLRIDPRLALPVGHPQGYPDAESYEAVWQSHRSAYLRFQDEPCGSLYHPCHDSAQAHDPCAVGATLPPTWCQVVEHKIEATLQAYEDRRSAQESAKAARQRRDMKWQK